MDHGRRIVEYLADHVEDLAAETSATIVNEVAAFGPIRDERLADELMTLARSGIGLLVEVLRRRSMPTPAELGFVGERAGRRARQLVPLSAQLHAYLIYNRVIGQAIRSQSGPTVAGYREALDLATMAQETALVTAMAMADAYLETVEGALADRERHRNDLFTELLASPAGLTEDSPARPAGSGWSSAAVTSPWSLPERRPGSTGWWMPSAGQPPDPTSSHSSPSAVATSWRCSDEPRQTTPSTTSSGQRTHFATLTRYSWSPGLVQHSPTLPASGEAMPRLGVRCATPDRRGRS